MPIVPYLAMTAAEINNSSPLPEKLAWMACHFSPYSTGLSNLPEQLPKGSMLILNDRTPIHGHNPEQICRLLNDTVEKLDCSSILLDFEQPDSAETSRLVSRLLPALPCPAAVSSTYAIKGYPVFLPPVPLDVSIDDYLAPWAGQEVWLEVSLEGEQILLSESGTESQPMLPEYRGGHFSDDRLHCRYSIADKGDRLEFSLYRTEEDLVSLLQEAEQMGVKTAVGLYQELGKK